MGEYPASDAIVRRNGPLPDAVYERTGGRFEVERVGLRESGSVFRKVRGTRLRCRSTLWPPPRFAAAKYPGRKSRPDRRSAPAGADTDSIILDNSGFQFPGREDYFCERLNHDIRKRRASVRKS